MTIRSLRGTVLGWVWAATLWAASAASSLPGEAIKVEAAVLDQLGTRLDSLLSRPLDPQGARDLLETSRAVQDGSLREAVLYTTAVAMVGAGESTAARSLATHLAQTYPASRYAERFAEASATPRAARSCSPACGKDCPACGGTGVPPIPPALKSMIEECRYLIRVRTRALVDENGTADVRDSGRQLTPPELKPALKAFADWMLLQQRRLETRIVTRLYATREGPAAVLHMHVTPEFTAQGYDWRLAIARACVKDWAVKCKDLNVTAGFRLYDPDGKIAGEFNYRNWRLWLPKDGEPPREPAAPTAPATAVSPGEAVPIEPVPTAPAAAP